MAMPKAWRLSRGVAQWQHSGSCFTLGTEQPFASSLLRHGFAGTNSPPNSTGHAPLGFVQGELKILCSRTHVWALCAHTQVAGCCEVMLALYACRCWKCSAETLSLRHKRINAFKPSETRYMHAWMHTCTPAYTAHHPTWARLSHMPVVPSLQCRSLRKFTRLHVFSNIYTNRRD